MQIILAQDADATRWDNYVCSKHDASPYHLYAWRQAIEDAYGQKGYYLIAEDINGAICGILPVIHIKPPLVSAQLCSLPYCDRGEALADSADITDMLVSKALEVMDQTGADRYDYRSTVDEEAALDPEQDTVGVPKVRMLLDLPESSDALLSSFKAKLRSQIRKAEKNGLTFEIGNDDSMVSDFYHVFTNNMRDLGSPTHSRKWFECIRRYYADRCIISIIRHEETAIGAGLVLFTDNTAAIPWASTLRSYNRLAPNMLLYWSLLARATDAGCDYFDFGRSTLGEGTYRFKKQWGARPVRLIWQSLPADNKISDSNSTTKKGSMRQVAETIWRKLPLPVTVFLGSTVRKYISL